MQIAQYPLKKCREAVWNDFGMAHTCELVNLHNGPCASTSVARTVKARDAWEEAHPDLVGQSSDGDIII